MAKLAAKKKPTKPDAPKKPTSRSKTGNAECSQAASNWQLSIRGKATLNPGTYQTLAKCRALSKSGQMADAQGRTGKLSDQGAAALKGRLQSRFDSGLITQKSRQDRLETLLKQRKETQSIEDGYKRRGMLETRYASDGTAFRTDAKVVRQKRSDEARVLRSERGKAETAKAASTPPPASVSKAQPHSLGGKLAPGRGTEERKATAEFLVGMRKSGKLKSTSVGLASLMVAQDIRKGVNTPEALTDTLVTMRTKAFLEVPSEYRIRKGKKISERMGFRIKHHESTDIIARHALGQKGYEEYARRVESATSGEIANQRQYFLSGYDKNYRPVENAYKLIYPAPLSIKPKRKLAAR